MEAVMILTDAAHADKVAVTPVELDMSTGYDNRDFEAVLPCRVEGGALLYVDGSDLGGVIDDYETSTDSSLTVCHGRTWDGIMEGRVIQPPSGRDYLQVTGEANSVLGYLVEYLDLGDLFAARSDDSGIQVDYTFPRYQEGCTGYVGIVNMLAASGAKLRIMRLDGTTWLWAEAVNVITDEADSDVMEFAVKKQHRCVNHLVCAGQGEKQERVVIDLYADENRNISRTQTLFGADRIDALYSYTGADYDELLAEGTKELLEYQTAGSVDVTSSGKGDWDVGDVLEARDNRTGTVVQVPIRGKLAKVSSSTNWTIQIKYEVGSDSAVAGTSTSGTAEGSTGVIYRAGEGIAITSGTISAEVTGDDLEKVASGAADAARVASATSSVLSSHVGRTDNPHSVTAAQVGLGNVDNTSDADKPISDATQDALDGKADSEHGHDAADVTSGTLDAARIPGLAASKITSGTFAAARLPLATTSEHGAVIPDGTTITVSDGVISAQPGGAAAFLAAYPIGSYYIGDTSPASYGGSWTAYKVMGMPPMWKRTA